MEKLKFIGWVLLCVGITYLVLTVAMPLIVSTAGTASTEIGTSPNAAAYASSRYALGWLPLGIYFIPGVIGIAAIVWRLRKD